MRGRGRERARGHRTFSLVANKVADHLQSTGPDQVRNNGPVPDRTWQPAVKARKPRMGTGTAWASVAVGVIIIVVNLRIVNVKRFVDNALNDLPPQLLAGSHGIEGMHVCSESVNKKYHSTGSGYKGTAGAWVSILIMDVCLALLRISQINNATKGVPELILLSALVKYASLGCNAKDVQQPLEAQVLLCSAS